MRSTTAAGIGIGLAAALAFLALPSVASAQDFRFPFLQEAEEQVEELPMKSGVLLVGRLSAISGEIDPYIPVDYEDLFGVGIGASIEGRMMWEVEPGGWIGGYLSAGWDEFEGDRDTDDYGDSLESDGMEVTTLLAGFKCLYMFTPRVYCEGHLGVGVAHYGRVDGTLTTGGVPEDVTIFDSTTTGVCDVGARFGYARRRFVAEIGFGMRFQGSPDNADFDFDSSGPAVFSLEAAIGFQF